MPLNGPSTVTHQRVIHQRAAVIGGGISGLATAHQLRRLDPTVDVQLFESSDRLGGMIKTTEQDGFLIE
ncbi:Protoporphyrinogen oxidase [Planctomycetes bacterium K23_9]|uniref:Protoporphyrinogen oxidase n=1 Tax=Stieleria marina TaxID=1930275 RepID=A0A517NR95_9BACT|nr:Protoporphyrinogen oxidase [Planctomycetes bacterium K23_9]